MTKSTSDKIWNGVIAFIVAAITVISTVSFTNKRVETEKIDSKLDKIEFIDYKKTQCTEITGIKSKLDSKVDIAQFNKISDQIQFLYENEISKR